MRYNSFQRILRLTVFSALLSAISIVCGKYLAFNMGEFLRFSFENLPIIFAGAAFGSVVGAAVGAVADLVGCLLVGYSINPIVTLGAAAIGALAGLYRYVRFFKGGRLWDILKISSTVATAHLIGSVVIKSFGLSVFYDMPLIILMLWRLLNYLIVGVLEGFILYHLLRNKSIRIEISKIMKGKAKKMNYTEALEYIHSINWTFCKPGLERIEKLCAALGNPQKKLKFVHVAGTNGKGSFCSMLSSILVKAGYKVGLYTSPYIKVFNERMRIGGENIPNEKLVALTERIKPVADAMTDKPTEFELITALAFLYYAEEGCDIVVLEAGMGGRLDSTNVIDTSILSVITGISLDHTAFLGDTVEKIAAEKAGIIKRGVPVLFGGEDESAAEVISNKATEEGSAFYRPDYKKIENLSSTLRGTSFEYKGREAKLNLLGLYQPRNASLVLEAVELLRAGGMDISDKAIGEGLEAARWSARFEIINHSPLMIFDGAHNPEGIASAVESIKHYFGTERVIVVSGVLADKDYNYIASRLSEIASAAYTITPDNKRALTASDFAKILGDLGVTAEPNETITDALKSAIERSDKTGEAIVCLGSLYTYVDVTAALEKLDVAKRR